MLRCRGKAASQNLSRHGKSKKKQASKRFENAAVTKKRAGEIGRDNDDEERGGGLL